MYLINCGVCRFYEPDTEDKNDGFCQRYPPVAVKEGQSLFAIFPPVSAVDNIWCGEYSPRAAH